MSSMLANPLSVSWPASRAWMPLAKLSTWVGVPKVAVPVPLVFR
jgi:hypothetical protein